MLAGKLAAWAGAIVSDLSEINLDLIEALP